MKLATTKERALFTKCHWTEEVSLLATVYPFPLPSSKKCNALTSRVRGDRVGMPSSMKLRVPSSQPEARLWYQCGGTDCSNTAQEPKSYEQLGRVRVSVQQSLPSTIKVLFFRLYSNDILTMKSQISHHVMISSH